MRILMLAHRLPYPPRTGDKVRAYHVARHLARTHELTLACLVDEPVREAALAAAEREVGTILHAPIPRRWKRLSSLTGLLLGGCATVGYFDSPILRTRLASYWAATPPDLVYVSSSSMAQYVTRLADAPVLMDFVDVDSDKWRQYADRLPAYTGWLYRLESGRLRAYEVQAARSAARCLLATREEETLLHSFAPWAPTTVVPNGVDLEYFAPPPRPAEDPWIVFTGAMDYLPNVDAASYFCEAILPVVRDRVPDARFTIVGKNPVAAVRRLARLPGVEVTGTVDDVRPFLRRSAVAVAPLRIARGIQNKVLEAMAAGLPVVASSKAHQGLQARPGDELLVEDGAPQFAEAVARLLGQPGLRAELGARARRFVERHHGWAAALGRLDQVLDQVSRAWPASPRDVRGVAWRALAPDTRR